MSEARLIDSECVTCRPCELHAHCGLPCPLQQQRICFEKRLHIVEKSICCIRHKLEKSRSTQEAAQHLLYTVQALEARVNKLASLCENGPLYRNAIVESLTRTPDKECSYKNQDHTDDFVLGIVPSTIEPLTRTPDKEYSYKNQDPANDFILEIAPSNYSAHSIRKNSQFIPESSPVGVNNHNQSQHSQTKQAFTPTIFRSQTPLLNQHNEPPPMNENEEQVYTELQQLKQILDEIDAWFSRYHNIRNIVQSKHDRDKHSSKDNQNIRFTNDGGSMKQIDSIQTNYPNTSNHLHNLENKSMETERSTTAASKSQTNSNLQIPENHNISTYVSQLSHSHENGLPRLQNSTGSKGNISIAEIGDDFQDYLKKQRLQIHELYELVRMEDNPALEDMITAVNQSIAKIRTTNNMDSFLVGEIENLQNLKGLLIQETNNSIRNTNH